MLRAARFSLILLMPFRVVAWDDDAVLTFISRVNPIMLAQRNVSKAYAKPDAVTWALQNTSLSGRLGFGGTEFRYDPYTVYGGLQIQIPLSSIKEEREQALKLVAEAKALDDMHAKVLLDIAKVLLDIAQLRQMEAELEASEVLRKFLKEKAAWLKERIEQGYASEMDQLWTIGGKLNTEDALIAKVDVQAKTQRYKLAKYAGLEWPTLLDYLEGKTETLEGGDG